MLEQHCSVLIQWLVGNLLRLNSTAHLLNRESGKVGKLYVGKRFGGGLAVAPGKNRQSMPSSLAAGFCDSKRQRVHNRSGDSFRVILGPLLVYIFCMNLAVAEIQNSETKIDQA